LREGGSSKKSEMVSTLFSNGSQGSPTVTRQHEAVSMAKLQQQVMQAHDARASDQQITSSIKPSMSNSPPTYSEARDSTAGQIKMNNFDLNDIYIDSDDGMEDLERLPVSTNLVTSSLDYPWAQQDSHQSSPPQTSGNSDSASAQSPSSSSGEAQVCLSCCITLNWLFYSVLVLFYTVHTKKKNTIHSHNYVIFNRKKDRNYRVI